MDALRAGAKGFVEKTNTWDDFLVAVDRVGRGEQYFSAKSSGVTPMSAALAAARGATSGQRSALVSRNIAGKLFISVATVETHRTNLMAKLGVRNVAGLVLYFFQNGMVEAPVQSSAR